MLSPLRPSDKQNEQQMRKRNEEKWYRSSSSNNNNRKGNGKSIRGLTKSKCMRTMGKTVEKIAPK